ncbi:MAG: helix-turn-helix transcriptional regulator [Clostridia bacterium]
MSVGETITLLRKEKGLSQVEFAVSLNLDKSTIAKYETDKILPSVPMLIKIAQFFEVSTDYLLGLED